MNGRVWIGIAICLAGVIFTFVVPTGRIWYGAMIWGAIMAIRGFASND